MASKEYVNAVYFPNYRIYESKTPACLPIEHITHILYAFASVRTDGTIYLQDPNVDMDRLVDGHRGGLRACVALKQRNENLKIILSIGGGGFCSQNSRVFPVLASDSKARKTFAKSAIALIHEYGLDGIDIDWEYPSNDHEGQHFVQLLKACQILGETRQHLRKTEKYILIAALPAARWALRHIDLHQAHASVDFFNIMCYDFFGPWSDNSGYHAQLFPALPSPNQATCCDSAISYLLSHGVHSPRSLVLGLPLYGRGFKGTTSVDQAVQDKESTVYLYKDLPRPGTNELVDHQAGAAYCTDENEFVTYDNLTTVAMKAEYVKAHNLRGLFFWEGTADKRGSESLIEEASGVLIRRA